VKGEVERGSGEDADTLELQEMIKHWVAVIDRWVARVDQGMGGAADGAEPGVENDSPLDSAPGPI
jgi:hypothetical protein